MAHHIEPMDVDDIESDFDNKENAYHHSNVLPRTPCTEKGYEELDVSELNMKLRYSITPAASPMSKSMTQCLDNRYNASTDESLNNTVINENENNLTRSLHSALNKTDSKSPKVLPLQSLPADVTVDSNRNATILQPLATTLDNNITITLNNENDIDNLSFPSSSSSLTHTPEATTPTKEIPKDGGSPIMRGLKSVLSMFRSSQSPIPPAETEYKNMDAVLSPADVPDSKSHATASTPIQQRNKERSVSTRNSPHKESIVFNEDLEKELQWNDDSTIVFSTEKIPIHKLFLQDKPAKTDNHPLNEDANSSVEYMDVSYNDLSVRDRTLNATGNKSTAIDIPESDGEFVDCETTITLDEHQPITEEANPEQSNTEKVIAVNNAVNALPMFDTTVDIIKLIDGSQIDINTDETAKQLDFSTTDIVNQLSDLINASETMETNVSLDKHKVNFSNTEASKTIDVLEQTGPEVQPKLLEHVVTSSENPGCPENNISVELAENVSIENDKIENIIGNLPNVVSDTLDSNIEPVLPLFSLAPAEVISTITHEIQTVASDGMATHPSPCDIPLPDDDFNELTDNLVEENLHADEILTETLPIAETAQNTLLAALDKTVTDLTPEIKQEQVQTENENTDISCQLNLLPSDVPLPNMDDNHSIKINSLPHEAVTVVPDPVQPQLTLATEIYPVVENTVLLDNIETASPKENTDNEIITNSILTEVPFTVEPQLTLATDIVPVIDNTVPIYNIETAPSNENADNKITNSILTEVPFTVQPEVTLATEIDDVVDNTDSMVKIVTASPLENTDNEMITKSILTEIPTETVEPYEEEKMEISYCEEMAENTPIILPMDVTVATTTSPVQLDENVQEGDTPKPLEQLCIENLSLEIELPVTTQEINILAEEDILKSENQIDNALSKPASTITDNIAFVEESKIEPVVDNLESRENVEALSNPNILEAITASVFAMPQAPDQTLDTNVFETKPADVQISDIDQNISDDINNKDAILTSEAIEVITPTVNALCSDVSSLPAISVVENTIEAKPDALIAEEEDRHNTEPPKEFSINMDSDTVEIGQKPSQQEEIDVEIVVSENSSPFVSISAEEELDVEVKNNDLVEIETVNPFSSYSPPKSPKIVSKGYNLNFDDLDAMNPFATKAKVRMSPPPGASPNTSLDTLDLKSNEKSELFNKGKNDNRRKTMPAKRKPLKAQRNFNTTFDSTESATSKQVEPMNHEHKDLPKKDTDIKQNGSEISDKAQTGIITPITAEVAPEATNLDETYQVTDQVVDSLTNTTFQVEALNHNPNNTTKIIEDVVMSESSKSPVKSDNTSSSEQSTYLSAATSSTECITTSRNVFNLPEIDDKDFNPFATKSKMRQTPPPDLDMVNPFATKSKIKSSPETSFVITPNDVNTTVTVDSENKFQEPNYNLSNCSGSSSDEKDVTVQEVHTEDEDTIEGPFLEAEDVSEGDKIPEFNDDKTDTDFKNLNAQATEEDPEAAEMFIDAEAFEFLMNQNNTDEVAYSGKESLFLKFDPLFARRVTNEGVAAALSEMKKRQSTPKKMMKPVPPKEAELMSFEKLVAGPSNLNNTHTVQSDAEDIHDDMNVTVLSKPMMAVTPAVNPVVTPRTSLTPNRTTNRLSMTFTSPAMAVIDRLLSLSGNSPSAGRDAAVTHASRERTEADQALTQLRELLAEKEINVYNLRCESKELKSRLSTLETQMKSLEAVSAERLKKVNDLTENLAEKTKMNRSMAAVVEEYERTIASLISETEQDKKRFAEERNQLIRDRDEQTAHLTSMEVSFNDLHSKYEKSKQVIMGYKTNEEAYKSSIKEFEDNLAKMHSNYELLKQHATSKLNHANQELEKLNKAHEGEILKFNAMIKRKDLHITSLEESLAQKTKANEELTAICDELINKVG